MILTGERAGGFIFLVSYTGMAGFGIMFTRGVRGLAEGIGLAGALLRSADFSGDRRRRGIFGPTRTTGQAARTRTERADRQRNHQDDGYEDLFHDKASLAFRHMLNDQIRHSG